MLELLFIVLNGLANPYDIKTLIDCLTDRVVSFNISIFLSAKQR